MAANKHDPDNGGFAQIKPLSIRLTQAAEPGQPAAGTQRRGRSRATWVGLLLLVAAAALVIFVLPGRMRPADRPAPAAPSSPGTASPAAPAPATMADAGPASASPDNASGPFRDAQQAALRRESQDLLEQALDIQKSLQNMRVETWAGADYAAAAKLAQSGDAAYRQQDFGQSKALYEQALATLQVLQKRADQVHDDAVAQGNAALTDGHATAATQAFQTALTIRPDDADAAKGLKRAGTLDQVMALIAQGDGLLQQEKLDEARQAYTQALALDPDAGSAKRQLQQVDQLAIARKFTAAMSRGYAALDAGKLEQAATAFRDAAAIRPDAPEAKNALEQTQQKITTARIGQLLDEAGVLEASESWQEAMQRYDAALALDPNLPAAQRGRKWAVRRVNLDERLRAAIARPERLADEAVYAEARALLQEAFAVSAPGPALKKQLTVLGVLLEQAVIPVSVTLHSDGATSVTVYKVATLGQFESLDLSVRPGRYVAVGKRAGYRDVRVEFTVAAGQAVAPITVQCTDKITSGN